MDGSSPHITKRPLGQGERRIRRRRCNNCCCLDERCALVFVSIVFVLLCTVVLGQDRVEYPYFVVDVAGQQSSKYQCTSIVARSIQLAYAECFQLTDKVCGFPSLGVYVGDAACSSNGIAVGSGYIDFDDGTAVSSEHVNQCILMLVQSESCMSNIKTYLSTATSMQVTSQATERPAQIQSTPMPIPKPTLRPSPRPTTPEPTRRPATPMPTKPKPTTKAPVATRTPTPKPTPTPTVAETAGTGANGNVNDVNNNNNNNNNNNSNNNNNGNNNNGNVNNSNVNNSNSNIPSTTIDKSDDGDGISLPSQTGGLKQAVGIEGATSVVGDSLENSDASGKSGSPNGTIIAGAVVGSVVLLFAIVLVGTIQRNKRKDGDLKTSADGHESAGTSVAGISSEDDDNRSGNNIEVELEKTIPPTQQKSCKTTFWAETNAMTKQLSSSRRPSASLEDCSEDGRSGVIRHESSATDASASRIGRMLSSAARGAYSISTSGRTLASDGDDHAGSTQVVSSMDAMEEDDYTIASKSLVLLATVPIDDDAVSETDFKQTGTPPVFRSDIPANHEATAARFLEKTKTLRQPDLSPTEPPQQPFFSRSWSPRSKESSRTSKQGESTEAEQTDSMTSPDVSSNPVIAAFSNFYSRMPFFLDDGGESSSCASIDAWGDVRGMDVIGPMNNTGAMGYISDLNKDDEEAEDGAIVSLAGCSRQSSVEFDVDPSWNPDDNSMSSSEVNSGGDAGFEAETSHMYLLGVDHQSSPMLASPANMHKTKSYRMEPIDTPTGNGQRHSPNRKPFDDEPEVFRLPFP